MKLSNYWLYDFRAAIVVFLVALPLCLGIALASGAPLIAGLIAGVVGGIVVGSLSKSPLSVSGPAAGLTSIVASSISVLGTFEAFAFSVVVAGLIQLALGFFRAGTIGNFFPASVIKGMLAGIGLILILKQIPHAVGYDVDYEGDETFFQADGKNTFSELLEAFNYLTPGALVVSVVSLAILFAWEHPHMRKWAWVTKTPGALVAVAVGTLLALLFNNLSEVLLIESRHMVSVPRLSQGGASFFHLPDFSVWQNPTVYSVALTLALVASLETLLSIEASDKMDPYRRMTPLNHELKAQGVANTLSGLLGGLPLTSVIVRSSANIMAGAKSKASTITHGAILMLAVLLIPHWLEFIPLSCLAGILIFVGYKLTKPQLYIETRAKGNSQFIPFLVTTLAVLLTDLLTGVFIGLLASVFFILRTNFKQAVLLVNNDQNSYLLKFTKDVSFLNKSTVRDLFQKVPKGARLIIDGTYSRFIDQDIQETISDFLEEAKTKDIHVELNHITLSKKRHEIH
jgi:MFS superfamily sulfate permease-like transporter